MTVSKLILPSAGQCIYCGDLEDLRLEHVIPLSLGGLIELPQASCRECERITNSFEQPLGRETLVEVRAIEGIKSRRPKERPKTVPVKMFFASGRSKSVQVDLNAAPIAFVAPFYERLPSRASFPDELASALRFETCFHKDFYKNRLAIISKYGAEKTIHYTKPIQAKNFARLIWKIALGSLWSIARRSVLENEIRNLVLTNGAQYLDASAPAIEIRSQAKFQFRNLFSNYRLDYPRFAQVVIESIPEEFHRYIYARICFDGRLGLPEYVARIRNCEGFGIDQIVLRPEQA